MHNVVSTLVKWWIRFLDGSISCPCHLIHLNYWWTSFIMCLREQLVKYIQREALKKHCHRKKYLSWFSLPPQKGDQERSEISSWRISWNETDIWQQLWGCWSCNIIFFYLILIFFFFDLDSSSLSLQVAGSKSFSKPIFSCPIFAMCTIYSKHFGTAILVQKIHYLYLE